VNTGKQPADSSLGQDQQGSADKPSPPTSPGANADRGHRIDSEKVGDELGSERKDSVHAPSDQPAGERSDNQNRRISWGEICRKTLHMTPGFLPFLLLAVPHPDPLDQGSLEVIIVLSVGLTSIFLMLHRVVRRPGETNLISTALSYPATILVTLMLFPQHAEFACVVVVVLAFGDGMAYFGGRLLGKSPLPWNPDKTWMGTISFIGCSAPIATMAYWMEARNPTIPLAMAAICGTSAALAGALAESIPTKITDNLRVGVASALGVIAAHYATAGWFLK
jgi:farnesol kinase